jgi:hypothetical protein
MSSSRIAGVGHVAKAAETSTTPKMSRGDDPYTVQLIVPPHVICQDMARMDHASRVPYQVSILTA